jgi:transcriptional regulator with XRE-family HTH domain
MSEKDLESFREVLREAVAGSQLSGRDAEDVLGIGHGTLGRLLNGTLDLRVRHVLALARYLKVSPADFFVLGCPDAVRAAEHDLVEWVTPPRRRKAGQKDLPRTADELAALIRSAVQQELAARERKDG